MDSVSVSPDGDAAPWLPLPEVVEHLGVLAGNSTGDADRARLAAAAYVEDKRPDLATDVGFLPTADVKLGALLLTARLAARKASPVGLASYGEFGPAAVLRFDPDIERLLGIGRNARPVIG